MLNSKGCSYQTFCCDMVWLMQRLVCGGAQVIQDIFKTRFQIKCLNLGLKVKMFCPHPRDKDKNTM